LQISTKMVFECVCGWVCCAEWYGLSLGVSLCVGLCCIPKKKQNSISIIHYENIINPPKK
jgi:hypothetical protein